MNKVTDSVFYVGVNDHTIDLFEGMYVVPNGVAYNSYVVEDKEISVFDTVDAAYTEEWLANVAEVLGDRQPKYLIVQHMEPDHSASIEKFVQKYPEAKVVGNAKTFVMLHQFFNTDFTKHQVVVADMDTLCTGEHTFTFVFAPMVHWPEVIVTYDTADKVLFSADAFGKFSTLDVQEDWADEARRYYFGIVGKYGAQVQAVLKKAAALEIQSICPLHGPVLQGSTLTNALQLYDTWSSYKAEESGVVIAHASVYGNTREAAFQLAKQLEAKGVKVVLHDLTREDISAALADAFRYDRLVLAAATYNADVFPPMKTFLHWLTERGYRSRTIGLIENGSWAPMAGKVMRTAMEGCKDVDILEPLVSIRSALNEETTAQLNALADALA